MYETSMPKRTQQYNGHLVSQSSVVSHRRSVAINILSGIYICTNKHTDLAIYDINTYVHT